MFHKIMGNLEKMPAIGDIISYFSSIILIVTLKSAQKSNWGKKYEFFPLRPCNNFSTLTDSVLGGKYCKAKSNHIFPADHNLFLYQYQSWVFQLGGKYKIFFPPVFIFPPVSLFFSRVFIFSLLGHAINCSSFAGGVLGENILCLCFSPWPCCMVFILPIFWTCIWFPFSDSYGTDVHENDDIYPWLKCTFFCL
jgi:hypothetical protein